MNIPTTRESFWARVDKSPGQGPWGDCWLWVGFIENHGYGRVRFEGKLYLAHRLAFYFKHGRFPENKLLHKCDIPCCMNDAHHFEGTDADNVADMIAKGRRRLVNLKGEAHGCHKLTELQVVKIRTMAASGVRYGELAAAFEVHSAHIGKIVKGSSWKHLDGVVAGGRE